MARKTINVADVKARVNGMMTAPGSTGGRIALAVLLEGVLMDTGNYHGFRYLPSEYSDAQVFADTGEVLRPDYDDTRRMYY